MRRAIPCAVFALAAACAFPGAAAAQKAGFEIIPYGGYRSNGEVSGRGDLFDDRLDLEVDESALYGVAFDVPLVAGLKLELTVNRQESALNLDSGLIFDAVELGDITVTYAHAGLLWQWRLGQVEPYAGASAGLAILDPRFAGLDSEERFSVAFAGGVKTFFSPHLGLRFEARIYAIDLSESFDDCRDYCGGYDEALVQGEATVGLVLTW
jgi:hypothetical protein